MYIAQSTIDPPLRSKITNLTGNCKTFLVHVDGPLVFTKFLECITQTVVSDALNHGVIEYTGQLKDA